MDDESGQAESTRAEELAAVLEEEFSGSARLVRIRATDDSQTAGTLAVLVTVDPTETLFSVPWSEATGANGAEHVPTDMPEGVIARCEVTIARAHLERAEEDLVVVTRRLPGSPEQQAQAHAQLEDAREHLLLKEAVVAALGAGGQR